MKSAKDIWLADFICAPTWRDAAETLVEATVAATDDKSFESFPSENQSPGVRIVASRFSASLHEKHPNLAIAWDVLAWDSSPSELRQLAQALIDLVPEMSLPGIPRAQAIAHLRVWRKLARDDFNVSDEFQLDIFAMANMNWREEMSRVEDDDPRARPACRPPVSLLSVDRWDLAARELKEATLAEMHPNDAVIAMSPDIYGGSVQAARLRIDALVDILFDAGTEDAGELAIGWMMLACGPRQPARLHAVLPQLQLLVDRAFMGGEQRKAIQARLDVWWRAADGEFEGSMVSIFQIAARDTEMGESKTTGFGSLRRASIDQDPDIEVPDGPSLVVMPKDKSTKLDAGHSVHGAFKKLVDVRLPLIVARDVAAIRRQLHREYPHAVTAIDLVLRDLREDRPVTLKPFMLVGGPGTGKSRMVRRLGELLKLFVFRYDGAAALDGMFGGISKGWSSTQPSAPARAIEQAKQANPIVMIDEIEKGSQDSSRNGSLVNSLMPFLEAETAKRFRDPSLDAELDLSRVTFAATANDDTPLPTPLKDRFRIIRVPDPTLAHLPQLAANVMREMVAADETRMHDEPLADDELHNIGRAWSRSGLSMRKLQKIVSATLEARDQHAMRH